MTIPNKDQALVRKVVAEEFGKFVHLRNTIGNDVDIIVDERHGWSEEACLNIAIRVEMLITGLLYPRE